MRRIQYLFQVSLSLIKLFVTYVLSKFSKIDKVWLISERGYEARDNGYFFFKYLKENHPNIKVKYIISNNSYDLSKLDCYQEDIINYSSFPS